MHSSCFSPVSSVCFAFSLLQVGVWLNAVWALDTEVFQCYTLKSLIPLLHRRSGVKVLQTAGREHAAYRKLDWLFRSLPLLFLWEVWFKAPQISWVGKHECAVCSVRKHFEGFLFSFGTTHFLWWVSCEERSALKAKYLNRIAALGLKVLVCFEQTRLRLIVQACLKAD